MRSPVETILVEEKLADLKTRFSKDPIALLGAACDLYQQEERSDDQRQVARFIRTQLYQFSSSCILSHAIQKGQAGELRDIFTRLAKAEIHDAREVLLATLQLINLREQEAVLESKRRSALQKLERTLKVK